jgi:hypothetical protein
MDSIIGTILGGKWNELQASIEKGVASKILNRISDRKNDILAKINGISKDQMKETIRIKDEK